MRHGGTAGGVDDTMIGVTSPSKSTSDNPPGVDLQWGQTWPDMQEFRRLAATRRVVPVVRRVLADELSAAAAT